MLVRLMYASRATDPIQADTLAAFLKKATGEQRTGRRDRTPLSQPIASICRFSRAGVRRSPRSTTASHAIRSTAT